MQFIRYYFFNSFELSCFFFGSFSLRLNFNCLKSKLDTLACLKLSIIESFEKPYSIYYILPHSFCFTFIISFLFQRKVFFRKLCTYAYTYAGVFVFNITKCNQYITAFCSIVCSFLPLSI